MLTTFKQLFSRHYGFMFASLAFTLLLISLRVILTESAFGLFLVWNLFLAGLPLFMALWLYNLRQKKANAPWQMLLFAGWLLFFPNAMYLVTDLFHLKMRLPVPKWFDTLLLFSAAWNGMYMGFKSLTIIQGIFENMFNRLLSNLVAIGSLFLAGYGIFLGRYLRFNSWDVLSNPFSLMADITEHLIKPHHHLFMYGFVLLFGGFMCLVYFALQTNFMKVPPTEKHAQKILE